MIKKLLKLVIAASIIFSLAACTNPNNTGNGSNDNITTEGQNSNPQQDPEIDPLEKLYSFAGQSFVSDGQIFRFNNDGKTGVLINYGRKLPFNYVTTENTINITVIYEAPVPNQEIKFNYNQDKTKPFSYILKPAITEIVNFKTIDEVKTFKDCFNCTEPGFWKNYNFTEDLSKNTDTTIFLTSGQGTISASWSKELIDGKTKITINAQDTTYFFNLNPNYSRESPFSLAVPYYIAEAQRESFESIAIITSTDFNNIYISKNLKDSVLFEYTDLAEYITKHFLGGRDSLISSDFDIKNYDPKKYYIDMSYINNGYSIRLIDNSSISSGKIKTKELYFPNETALNDFLIKFEPN